MEIIGFGTEIVEVLRVARLIEKHGELFLRKVFTPREIKYCSSRSRANQHYAARWAAKRAVMKALGVAARGGVRWLDVEVRPRANEGANVALAGPLRDLCAKQSVGAIKVALGHCRSYATASAIVMESDEY
ncbi:MAG: holo-ACP synthase [Planctomycetota bacterium]